MKRYILLFSVVLFSANVFGGTSRIVGLNEQITTVGKKSACPTYNSFQEWEDNVQADLTVSNESPVLEAIDDSTSFDFTLIVDGSTPEEDHFMTIRPQSGSKHDGTTNNGFFVDAKSVSGQCVDMKDPFFTIQDIIIKVDFNATANRFVLDFNADNVKGIGVLIFDVTNSGSGDGRGILFGVGNNTLLVISMIDNTVGRAMRFSHSGDTTYIYNSLIVNNGGAGYDISAGVTISKNVLSDTNSGSDFDTGTQTGSINCASADGTATANLPADGHRASQTFTHVNEGGNDFHLGATDAGAEDFGTDLSSDAFFPFNDDIDGDLFNTWDIGMDENNPATGAVRRRAPIVI